MPQPLFLDGIRTGLEPFDEMKAGYGHALKHPEAVFAV